jgi:hypothetical protein
MGAMVRIGSGRGRTMGEEFTGTYGVQAKYQILFLHSPILPFSTICNRYFAYRCVFLKTPAYFSLVRSPKRRHVSR